LVICVNGTKPPYGIHFAGGDSLAGTTPSTVINQVAMIVGTIFRLLLIYNFSWQVSDIKETGLGYYCTERYKAFYGI